MAKTDFHEILDLGVREGASDWHIREGRPVVLRVSGKLVEVEGFTPTRGFLTKAVGQVCAPPAITRYEEHGDADFAHEEEAVGRFRVNLHRQRGRMCLTFRHVKPKVPAFEELGLPDVLREIASEERGIIIVTGTTGSGKSTTLAAMLEHMNDLFDRHVITIEDPIEFDFGDRRCIFEQREVGPDTSSFASALRHALRQDPDVIVVGEMRDRESFDAALIAADTGHLVLATLHTSNASQSVQRILDFYEEGGREQIRIALSTNLRAIISQRLVPRAEGSGVVPAMEILINRPIVRKLLHEGRLEKLPQAIETGGGDGMMTFNQSLLRLIEQGVITERTALEKATNPEQLQMNLNGIFLSAGAIIG